MNPLMQIILGCRELSLFIGTRKVNTVPQSLSRDVAKKLLFIWAKLIIEDKERSYTRRSA